MIETDVIGILGKPSVFDSTVRAWVHAHQSRTASAFLSWVSIVGSVTPMAMVAVAGAVALFVRGRRHAVGALLLAPLAALITYHYVKGLIARTRPSGAGNFVDGTYSFPSAHATTAAAVCATLAYVFWRERLVHGAIALQIAVLVPLVVGASRVYLDAHWATDVIGGWGAGLLVAMLSAALYHRCRIAAARLDAARNA
jgi:membrane-associated phospholipid phosphatase